MVGAVVAVLVVATVSVLIIVMIVILKRRCVNKHPNLSYVDAYNLCIFPRSYVAKQNITTDTNPAYGDLR